MAHRAPKPASQRASFTGLRRLTLLTMLPLAVVACVACSAEVPVGAEPVEPAHPAGAEQAAAPVLKPLPEGFRLHTEPVTQIRFPVLASGVVVEAKHYDPTLPVR